MPSPSLPDHYTSTFKYFLSSSSIKNTKTILRDYRCGIDGAYRGKTPQKSWNDSVEFFAVLSLRKRQIQRDGKKQTPKKEKAEWFCCIIFFTEGIVLDKWMFLSSCRELGSFSFPGITSDKNISKRFFFLRVFSEVMLFPLLFLLLYCFL